MRAWGLAPFFLLAGCFGFVAHANAEADFIGYAGVGAKRFTFTESGLPDAQPVSADLFAGVDLHRFLGVEFHIAVPVKKDDSNTTALSGSLYDAYGQSLDLQSTTPAKVSVEVPLYAAFFAKPKVSLGPVELYLLAGAAYTKIERNIAGNFDGQFTLFSGNIPFSNAPFEIESEREALTFSYGGGAAVSLGRLRINAEYTRIQKADATKHSCYDTSTTVIWCDALFADNELDAASVGLSLKF